MDILDALQVRFDSHPSRHPSLPFADIEPLLDEAKLSSLAYMEESGGEADVFTSEGRLFVVDFSHGSPRRRSVCYDGKVRMKRKRDPPEVSALELCSAHGLSFVPEGMYLALQEAEPLDEKMTSWILTPEDMGDKRGALFGSKRYGRTFIYCNGADSCYS